MREKHTFFTKYKIEYPICEFRMCNNSRTKNVQPLSERQHVWFFFFHLSNMQRAKNDESFFLRIFMYYRKSHVNGEISDLDYY